MQKYICLRWHFVEFDCSCNYSIPTIYCNCYRSVLSLANMLLEDAIHANEDTKHLSLWIQAAFILAGIWGIGGTLDTASQIQYDEFYKVLWKGE